MINTKDYGKYICNFWLKIDGQLLNSQYTLIMHVDSFRPKRRISNVFSLYLTDLDEYLQV